MTAKACSVALIAAAGLPTAKGARDEAEPSVEVQRITDDFIENHGMAAIDVVVEEELDGNSGECGLARLGHDVEWQEVGKCGAAELALPERLDAAGKGVDHSLPSDGACCEEVNIVYPHDAVFKNRSLVAIDVAVGEGGLPAFRSPAGPHLAA